MKKIKIAQIGLNEYSHSVEIFESLEKQSDIFEIVGYALPENEENRLSSKAARLQKYKQMTVNSLCKLSKKPLSDREATDETTNFACYNTVGRFACYTYSDFCVCCNRGLFLGDPAIHVRPS